MTKSKNTPKLRFPEFTEEWEEKKLGDILEVRYGKDYKHLGAGKYPVLGTGGIMTYVDTYLYSKESVLIGRKGSINNPFYINEPFWTVDTLFYTDIHDSFPKFVFYLVSTINWFKYNEASGVPSLSASSIKNVKIKISSFAEQEKISKFLTKVDEKISLLEDKLDLFKDFKKFCMQQLFAQKLRFKNANGENYPDWEETILNDMMKHGKAGGTPTSTESTYYDGDIPFLSIADMTSQGKYILETEKTITKDGLNNSSAWIIPENSLLYSIYASVGFVAINKRKITTSQAIFGIIFKNNFNLEFMFYLLTDFKKQLPKYIETGTQGNLNSKIIKNFEFKIPILEEQIKIANFLTIVDTKIDKLNVELENMKEFKNGLLQQMFI